MARRERETLAVRLRAITDLDAEHAAALAGFEAVIKNEAAGDGATDLIHKIKFWNKLDALNALAQHLGLLKNQMELSGLEDLFARLDPTVRRKLRGGSSRTRPPATASPTWSTRSSSTTSSTRCTRSPSTSASSRTRWT
jgi:hypothetical protein